MFRPNALKQRLRAGKRALGCWTVLGSPPVIELLAYCGFDYLLLDQEHGFGEPSALLHCLQAMAATPNCTSVVRVPSNDPNYLKRVLDAGVEGVMVPNIETAEDVAARVRRCLEHAPADRLSFAPDCGLSQTARWAARLKLQNMVRGVKMVRKELGI